MENGAIEKRTEPLYRILAALVGQHARCVESNNTEWRDRSAASIVSLVRDHMPRGSGFDNGTKLDMFASTSEKLVFTTAFHHMNSDGYYDGWTDHTVTVRPILEAPGYCIHIGGRNRNEIKDYMHDCFDSALSAHDVQYPTVQS